MNTLKRINEMTIALLETIMTNYIFLGNDALDLLETVNMWEHESDVEEKVLFEFENLCFDTNNELEVIQND